METSDEEENFKKTVSERRNIIEKRLSVDRTIPASSQRVEIVQEITSIKRQSLVEDKVAEVEEKQKLIQDPTKPAAAEKRTVSETTALPATAQREELALQKTEKVEEEQTDSLEVEHKPDRRDSELLEGVTQRFETDRGSIVARISGNDGEYLLT